MTLAPVSRYHRGAPDHPSETARTMPAKPTVPDNTLSRDIWDMKYRLRDAGGDVVDKTVEDTWRRVAGALAAPELPGERSRWQRRFYAAMKDYRFLPGGRILAGAGAQRRVTLFNCFVMGGLSDDMTGIFDALKEAALTLQQGGGIGQDFSSLRPAGAPVKGVGADASGPVSFMDIWDAMCRTIMSAGSRRGAMMATLACDHPDIEAFIEAKRDKARLRMFNLSVLVSDAFLEAVRANADWPLKFAGRIHRTVNARMLWERIMRSAYDYAEPGVIFIDRVNARNNLNYCETINATNPCGEQPLPPYGACLLGSINLAALVTSPFTDKAALDLGALRKLVGDAVRALDNVIDISRYPLAAQKHEAHAKRRIGLGLTGLGDALILCRERYGSESAAALAAGWMREIQHAAYVTSAALADEKGAFALFDRDALLASPGIAGLPAKLRARIAKSGLRNALLTTIAPTGTISLFAGNVSSGIEPVFANSYERTILMPDGGRCSETVTDFAYRRYLETFGADAPLPDYFVTAQTLKPGDHLRMQGALQPYVDSAISKTINCPADISFEDFTSIYLDAYDLGLKGCTAFRPNEVTGAVLSAQSEQGGGSAQESLALAAPAPPASSGDVVYMKQPLERHATLPGFTYKIRWPDSSHAIYITLNDIIQDGHRRPFEIFINSKNMEHYAWTVALTRMISAVFRRGGDVSFVVEELKAVFDPRGGQWMDGRYVPSLLAAIGDVVERHMIDTGFLAEPGSRGDSSGDLQRLAGQGALKYCPKCDARALVFQEGCHTCLSCGYSKCS